MTNSDSTPPTAEHRLDHAQAPRVGVIGLGSMGAPMAHHLLTAHDRVVVHSRTRKQELIDAGAIWADTPRELAEQVDAVLVMLPDLPQLEPMLEGPQGLLAGAGELLVMVGSTSSPIAIRALGERLSDASSGRVRVVDVPVSGGDSGARAGTLSIMAGGTERDVALASQILSPCGTVRRMGPLGAGEVTKACNQMIVGATMLALAEATVLAERSGIDLVDLYDVLGGGYAGSNLLQDKRAKLIDRDDAPGGVAAYMLKDLGFGQEVAADTDTHPALLPALQAAYRDLVDAGLGTEDLSVTRRFTEERGG